MAVQPTRLDPAQDAARLLGRLGFAILMIAAPLAAVGGRRALVILVPAAVVLLILAAAIESDGREPWRRAREMILTPAGGLLGFLLFWAALSLVWTPFPVEAAERLANVAGTVALALLCSASLPRRMRASNIYLLPIGVALTTVALIGSVLRPGIGLIEEGGLAQRAALLCVLLTPAMFTWLAMRGKLLLGYAVVGLVALAALAVQSAGLVAVLAIGAGVYALAMRNGRLARRIVLGVTAGLLLCAPLVPFLLRPITKFMFGLTDPKTEAVRVWMRIVTQEPARLLTGHGFDTAIRARLAGLVPANSPRGLLFELWYELGLLGAIAAALLLWRIVAASAQQSARDGAAILALLAIGFVLAMLGQGATQAWWLLGLLVAIVALSAVLRAHERAVRLTPSGPFLRP
jgi:hypothetical protein